MPPVSLRNGGRCDALHEGSDLGQRFLGNRRYGDSRGGVAGDEQQKRALVARTAENLAQKGHRAWCVRERGKTGMVLPTVSSPSAAMPLPPAPELDVVIEPSVMVILPSAEKQVGKYAW